MQNQPYTTEQTIQNIINQQNQSKQYQIKNHSSNESNSSYTSSNSSSIPSTTSNSLRKLKQNSNKNQIKKLSNDQTSDDLSIRFISGPGISTSTNQTPIKPKSTTNTTTTTNLTSPNTSSNTNSINQSLAQTPTPIQNSNYLKPNSPSESARRLSRIPISAVAFGRTLAGDTHLDDHHSIPSSSENLVQNHSDTTELIHSHSDPQTSAESSSASLTSPLMDEQTGSISSEPFEGLHPIVSRLPRNNPFFSSGGGRDRGAMIHQNQNHLKTSNGGNTGKVITTLQSDLLYARTALDQSKSQLRLSQRAVESLNRQTEDLKESMSRLRLENEGLNKMLSRKERTVSELIERVKKSESELNNLKQDKKELDSNLKKISKETDEVVKDSIRRRDRAESQYEAIKSGVKNLSDGWKRDVSLLKQDLSKIEEKHRKEMEESRLKYNTLAKLHASRSGALTRIETNLNDLQSSKEEFINKYSKELKEIKEKIDLDSNQSIQSFQLANEVAVECARFKRILRNHKP